MKELIEREKPKLIVIDTLAKVRPAQTNSNVYEQDYKALAPLTELANKHRCCIVVVHHNRKGKSDADALEQISGSLGLVGAVDGALVIDGVRSDTLQGLPHLIIAMAEQQSKGCTEITN